MKTFFVPKDETKLTVNYKLTTILSEVIEKVGIDEKRVACLGLYGSQNYNMDSENSDIDCECFIFPTRDDIIFGNRLYSTCINTSYGTCHVKDIRMAFNELRKASPNILEVFATPYALINIEYSHLFSQIDDCINYFAVLNPYRFIHGLEGLLRRYEKDIENPKYFANYIRICEMIERAIQGDNYKDLLIPKNSDYLTELKYSDKIANNTLNAAKECAKVIKQIMEDFYSHSDKGSNQGVLAAINFYESELMEKYIKLEF